MISVCLGKLANAGEVHLEHAHQPAVQVGIRDRKRRPLHRTPSTKSTRRNWKISWRRRNWWRFWKSKSVTTTKSSCWVSTRFHAASRIWTQSPCVLIRCWRLNIHRRDRPNHRRRATGETSLLHVVDREFEEAASNGRYHQQGSEQWILFDHWPKGRLRRRIDR
jgi:hypothetical protein